MRAFRAILKRVFCWQKVWGLSVAELLQEIGRRYMTSGVYGAVAAGTIYDLIALRIKGQTAWPGLIVGIVFVLVMLGLSFRAYLAAEDCRERIDFMIGVDRELSRR